MTLFAEVKAHGETRACYQLPQGQPVKADAENEGEQRAQREIAVRIAPEMDDRPLGGEHAGGRLLRHET